MTSNDLQSLRSCSKVQWFQRANEAVWVTDSDFQVTQLWPEKAHCLQDMKARREKWNVEEFDIEV